MSREIGTPARHRINILRPIGIRSVPVFSRTIIMDEVERYPDEKYSVNEFLYHRSLWKLKQPLSERNIENRGRIVSGNTEDVCYEDAKEKFECVHTEKEQGNENEGIVQVG